MERKTRLGKKTAGKRTSAKIISLPEDTAERQRSEIVQAALFLIADRSSAAQNLNELFPQLHAVIDTLLYAKNFFIALSEAGGTRVIFPFAVDEHDSFPASREARKGLTEYVLRTGKPLLVNREQMLRMAASGDVEIIGTPSESWLGVPLARGDRVFGVMVVQSYSKKISYGPKERDLLIFVSQHIANAIWRKQVEQDLRQRERFLNNIFDGIQDGISVIDRELRVIRVNQTIEKWYAHRQPILGRRCYEVFYERKEVCQKCPTVRAMETDTAHTEIVQYIGPKGNEGWLELFSFPLRNEAHEIEGVIEFVRNITQRREAEEAQKESEKRFKETLNLLPDIVVELGPDGRLQYANIAAYETTGFPESELHNGFYFQQIVHPDDRLNVWNHLYDKVRRGESFWGEIRIQKKAGMFFEAVIRANPIHKNGEIVGIRCSISDITFLKQMVKSLQKSEQKYRALFEDSRDAVYMSNIDGHFVDINRAGVEMFGHSTKDELLTADILNNIYVNVEDRFRFQSEIQRRGFVKDFELLLRRKDGKHLSVSVTANAEHNEKGEILGYRGIIRDQTERRVLEQQFLQAQKMESIGLLAGGIAHDFNNILVGILGYASFLKMKLGSNHEYVKYADIIEKSASRAAELTSQLLAFGRGGKYDIKPVNVNSLVREVLNIIVPTFDKSIEIETHLDESIPLVEIDAAHIHQVLINLCVNARDAMPRGGKLQIDTHVEYISRNESHRQIEKKPGWFTVLVVKDSGVGMDAATLRRIFEPFFTTKEKGKGTGLGLSMVYGVVKNHGGFIHVESEPKKGAAFHVYLPFSKKQEQKETVKVEDLVGGTEGILVIDDEESIRFFCQDVLEGYGYQVFLAENGEAGIRVFQENRQRVKLVILDMIMPKLGGKETLEKLREIDPETRVLFSTGFGENEEVKRILTMGVQGFLQKPYQVKDMVAKVRQILDGVES